ncbi:GGDEF domain-containing protein [Vibrio sp. MACH09]|uniref:GGDEF domain-containing protein n=1 Tax=unclassified Vibrio TaxID=2614977 RepID=UPI001493D080|nr:MULTISPECIES: GGDEF domain-containing protein [unclassified Vibrio]NOI66769.1 GGDEF domain-containing protein [Vibrio sp. 99-8-1]GLO62822.1 GGDEF domain-containing protein [Vibrio sp. MACH09]
MTDIEKIKLTHPYLRVSKTLLLIFAVVLFVLDIMLYFQTDRLAKTYTEQQNQATWFLFQLSKEFSELVAHSDHMDEDASHINEVLLKYELTWSRFDLLVNNRESDSFMKIADAKQFFSQLFTQFQELEPMMEQVANGNQQVIQEFYQRADALHISMIDYINQNFRVASPLYEEQRKKARALATADFYLVLGIVVCICLLFYVLYKESVYIKKLALTDPLTGLFNRLALFSLLENYDNDAQDYTLCLLDLNGFKQINDDFGHQAGDAVLIEVARRLQSHFQQQCLVFRIGGDEFALVLKKSVCQQGEIDQFCCDVLNQFGLSFNHNDVDLSFSASIGCANFPQDSKNIDDLVQIADRRMYQMKRESQQA